MAEGWPHRLAEHASGAEHLCQRQPRLRQAAKQDRRVRRAGKRHP